MIFHTVLTERKPVASSLQPIEEAVLSHVLLARVGLSVLRQRWEAALRADVRDDHVLTEIRLQQQGQGKKYESPSLSRMERWE